VVAIDKISHYKIRHGANGRIEKYKARFVAKELLQVEGIDYDNTVILVAKYSSIKAIVAITLQMGWRIHHMNVKTMFLNGVVEEEIYIEQLEGFETCNKKTHVCRVKNVGRLKRAVYGLK